MTVDTPIVGSLGQYVLPFLLPVVVPCVMLLAARRLWYEYLILGKDHSVDLPLPDGGMGWPVIGETISFALQVRSAFISVNFCYVSVHLRNFKTKQRRAKYNCIVVPNHMVSHLNKRAPILKERNNDFVQILSRRPG